MRPTATPRDHFRAIATLWLGLGAALLLTTLVPAHTALLGWSPALWLLGAPLALRLALEPAWPLRLLARYMRHRARRPQTAWL